MFKRFLIVILSAACVMALAACGTGASAGTDTAAETETAEAGTMPDEEEDTVGVEWTIDDIAALSGIVSGITDREYAAGEGAAYKIHEDIAYDRDVVYTVLFNTASVRFDTPGAYDMTYWVYFDAAALKIWADGNGVSLDVPDAGRLAAWVSATVTVTEAGDTDDGDAEDDAAEADEDTASGVSGDESASAGAGSAESGSKSASSGSSKSSSSASCSHDWVDEGHYESVLVQAAYDEKVATGEYVYRCTKCGFETKSGKEIEGHNSLDGGGSTSVPEWETVHHDAVYETQWVSSYKCSKCGATK